MGRRPIGYYLMGTLTPLIRSQPNGTQKMRDSVARSDTDIAWEDEIEHRRIDLYVIPSWYLRRSKNKCEVYLFSPLGLF